MKAKVDTKFALEEKRMVDAAIGLILFGFAVVLIVMGLVSITSSAATVLSSRSTVSTPASVYIYPLFEIIWGIITFAFSMWVFKVRV